MRGVWRAAAAAGLTLVAWGAGGCSATAAKSITSTTAPRISTTSTSTSTTTTTTLAPSTTSSTSRSLPLTSCASVVHIGDSTSESLISDDYISPAQQLPAQYHRVGVRNVVLEISGARSIVETFEGQPNGYEVAQQLIRSGYHGCWVIALGTNDAANIAAGANIGAGYRIHEMMTITGGQPVMWVNVVSLVSSGPYAESSMQRWDQALLAACPKYPSMRVFGWAAIARPSWFVSDGIHYSSVGSVFRSADIADALAAAFPRTPPTAGSRSCVVR